MLLRYVYTAHATNCLKIKHVQKKSSPTGFLLFCRTTTTVNCQWSSMSPSSFLSSKLEWSSTPYWISYHSGLWMKHRLQRHTLTHMHNKKSRQSDSQPARRFDSLWIERLTAQVFSIFNKVELNSIKLNESNPFPIIFIEFPLEYCCHKFEDRFHISQELTISKTCTPNCMQPKKQCVALIANVCMRTCMCVSAFGVCQCEWKRLSKKMRIERLTTSMAHE